MLAHDRTGSGPPLLLLHGLGSCKEMWRPVVPLLAREREVIAVDLPGFGASPPGAGDRRGARRRASRRSPPTLGLERPHVAGNSMGGGVALALAARGRVRVGLRGVADRLRRPTARRATRARVLATTRVLARALAPVADALARSRACCGPRSSRTSPHGRGGSRPRTPRSGLRDVRRRRRRSGPLLRTAPDWRAPRRRSCPTTVAWGDRDRLLIYSRQAPRARRMLPDARHVTLTRLRPRADVGRPGAGRPRAARGGARS